MHSIFVQFCDYNNFQHNCNWKFRQCRNCFAFIVVVDVIVLLLFVLLLLKTLLNICNCNCHSFWLLNEVNNWNAKQLWMANGFDCDKLKTENDSFSFLLTSPSFSVCCQWIYESLSATWQRVVHIFIHPRTTNLMWK